jgi:hypothetical protein
MLNATLLSFVVLTLAGCQTREEIWVGGLTYQKRAVTYVEKTVTVSSYQFPRKPVGELGIAQVRLSAKRLSAESISLRGSLVPQMEQLAAHYDDAGDQDVFSIGFLDVIGDELARQDVTFSALVPAEDDRYTFSIDADIDADRFDSVESIAIDWSQRLDDAVAAFIESDEGKIWVNEH